LSFFILVPYRPLGRRCHIYPLSHTLYIYLAEFELWPGESARIGPVLDETTGTRQLIEGRNIAPFDIDNRQAFTNQFLAMENQGLHPIEQVRRLYRYYHY
jgi:hypothetical protein